MWRVKRLGLRVQAKKGCLAHDVRCELCGARHPAARRRRVSPHCRCCRHHTVDRSRRMEGDVGARRRDHAVLCLGLGFTNRNFVI